MYEPTVLTHIWWHGFILSHSLMSKNRKQNEKMYHSTSYSNQNIANFISRFHKCCKGEKSPTKLKFWEETKKVCETKSAFVDFRYQEFSFD